MCLHIFIPLVNQGMVYLLCAVKLQKVGQEGSCQLLPGFLSHRYIPSSDAASAEVLWLCDPATHASALTISPQVEYLSRSSIVHPQHCLVAVGE